MIKVSGSQALNVCIVKQRLSNILESALCMWYYFVSCQIVALRYGLHNSFPQSVKWLFVSLAHLDLGLAAGDSALILFHLAHLHGSHCLLQWLNLDCLHTTLGTL